MFKKIVFIIAFIAVYTFLGLYFASNPNNDSSDYSNGGSITNNVYQNTKYGFSIDLSDNWVYFTPETIDKVQVAQYGVSLSDFGDGTVLLGFAKPDRSIACGKTESPFSAKYLNLPSLRELAYNTAIYLEESGATVLNYDAGLIGTSEELYYYYLDCKFEGKETTLIYAIFNPDKNSSILVRGYYPMGEKDDFIGFLEKNLKLSKNSADNYSTSL